MVIVFTGANDKIPLYGYDTVRMRCVPLPQEDVELLGAQWDETIREWVIVGAKTINVDFGCYNRD